MTKINFVFSDKRTFLEWEMYFTGWENVDCFQSSKQSVVTLDSSLNTMWNTKVTSYLSGCLRQQDFPEYLCLRLET